MVGADERVLAHCSRRRLVVLLEGYPGGFRGTRRIAEAISDDISLAAYLGELVSNSDDFELLAPVELSICCFRYVPPGVNDDAELDRVNERVMERVQKGGRAYISNATVNGRFALRACITNFRTTKSDIDETVEAIRDAGGGL